MTEPTIQWMPRFRLRTLFIAVALLAAVFAGIGWWIDPWRRSPPKGSTLVRDAARHAYEYNMASYEAGQIKFSELMVRAEYLCEAERAVCTTRDQENKVLRDHLTRMKYWRPRVQPNDQPTAAFHYERARWLLAQFDGGATMNAEIEMFKKLEGHWEVESVRPAKKADDPALRDTIGSLEFRGGVVRWRTKSDSGDSGMVDLDVASSPPKIEMHINGGDSGCLFQGVFLVDEKLELCVDLAGKGIPTSLNDANNPTLVLKKIPDPDWLHQPAPNIGAGSPPISIQPSAAKGDQLEDILVPANKQ